MKQRIATIAVFFVTAWGTTGLAAGDPAGKFKMQPKVDIAAQPFSLTQVRLLDGPFKDAMEKDGEYLLSLEPDRLLSWFRLRAGLEPKAPVYGGWESMGVAGHSLGHYLSACSMLYAATGDARFKTRTDYIVDELKRCQDKNGNGYLAAYENGKQAFAEVRRGEIRSAGFDLNGIWVPWYTNHKVMAGLRDTYLYCDNDTALDVLVKMSDWTYETTKDLTDAQWQKMLACEHGGMNEVLADVYALTGNPKYLELSKAFYHRSVLDPLAAREDRLAGLHANTQVPKTIGAARIYELTGEKPFETIASFFWDRVTHHHSYVNGGNSADEHFGEPDRLNDRLHDTTETCNTYNMLKLTRHLFGWRPEAGLMDYYERALYNHILAHQNPETGMFMYKGFLDMPARKNFSTPFDSFWCCVGTGMENHVKYGDTIYYHDEDTVYVNLFIASQLTWAKKGLTLRQETDFPQDGTVRLIVTGDGADVSLKVRKPYWADAMRITRRGEAYPAVPGQDGYIRLEGPFAGRETIEIAFDRPLFVETMPDNPQRIAFFAGPILLAADLSGDKPLPLLVGRKQEFVNAIEPAAGQSLEYVLHGFDKDLAHPDRAGDVRLRPLYRVVDQPYTVYMDSFTEAQWAEQKAKYAAQQKAKAELDAKTVDFFEPGQMQPERDHRFSGEQIEAGRYAGRTWRHAVNGGWMEFDMAVSPDEPMDLWLTYWGSDAGGRAFDIRVDGRKIGEQVLNADRPDTFYDAVYPIPTDLTKGKDSIRVRLQAHPNRIAGGLYGCRTVRRGD